eukprot:tig00020746_g13653.t1
MAQATRCAEAVVKATDPGEPRSDPCAPDADVASFGRFALAFCPPQFLVVESKIGAVGMKRADRGRTPAEVHALYHVAEFELLAGDRAAAQRSFAKCAAAYGGRLGHLYPPEHPRRRRVEEALEALRAKRLPPARHAEFLGSKEASPAPGAGAAPGSGSGPGAAGAGAPGVPAHLGLFGRVFLSRRSDDDSVPGRGLQRKPPARPGGKEAPDPPSPSDSQEPPAADLDGGKEAAGGRRGAIPAPPGPRRELPVGPKLGSAPR